MRLSQGMAGVLLPLVAVGLAVSLLAGAAPRPSGALSAEAPEARGYEGHTLPSEYRKLALRHYEVIKTVHVKPGDMVKAGQILLEEDDREEQAKRRITKLLAESEVAINAAIKMRDFKVVEFQRAEEHMRRGVGSQPEFDRAKVEVDLAALDIEKSRLDREQKKLELELADAMLQGMRIVAPFDGVVQDVALRDGEVLDPQKHAISLVKIDPLWVEVYIPTTLSLKLKVGQELPVYYPELEETTSARVIFLDPVADAAGRKQLVRLEMPNPERRPAGLSVEVHVPQAPSATVKAP